MANILLFGPHEAGKTQLYKSLKWEVDPPSGQTDLEEYRVNKDNFWGFLGLSKYSIYEIGGKDIYLKDKDLLQNNFLTNDKLVFVFNGNTLIDELSNPEKGGYISHLLRCYVMPALKLQYKEGTLDVLKRDIRFIATHEDQYSGLSDMESEIFSKIEKANSEYLKIANALRYPFKELFRGNLFCVDARDCAHVSEVMKQILK